LAGPTSVLFGGAWWRPADQLCPWHGGVGGRQATQAVKQQGLPSAAWTHDLTAATLQGDVENQAPYPVLLPPKRMLVLVDNPFQYWKCQLDCWKNKFEVTYTLLIRQLHPIHPPTVHLYFVPRVYFSHPPNIEFTPEILFFGVLLDIYFRVYNIKGIRWVITASLIWMLKINRSHIPILLGNTHSGGLYT